MIDGDPAIVACKQERRDQNGPIRRGTDPNSGPSSNTSGAPVLSISASKNIGRLLCFIAPASSYQLMRKAFMRNAPHARIWVPI